LMTSADRRSRKHFDFYLLINMYVLIVIGVVMVAVATFDPDVSLDVPLLTRIMNSNTGSWQAIFFVASIIVVWVVTTFPYEYLSAYSVPFFMVTSVMLLFVLSTKDIRNVSGWFQLTLGRMLQPSEFAKLTLILLMAKLMSGDEKPLSSIKSVVKIFGLSAVPLGLTFLQGETGNVVVMLGILYIMLVFAGTDWRWLALLFGLAAAAVAALFLYGLMSDTQDYRLLRLLSFLNPQAYVKSAGYQILNSQQAIGSGGLTGIGMFIPGSLSQLNFVPEDWTDFIFATLGEAWGFVGCVVVILLFVSLLLRMLYLARFTQDKFGRLVIAGVMGMFFVHVFQNVAMTVGLMPITGIPLPFISYGGSNLMTSVAGVSLVLNVTNNRTTAMSSYLMPVYQNKQGKRGRRKKKRVYVNVTQR